jgi:DNA-binding transcriptional ArsR family regulator
MWKVKRRNAPRRQGMSRAYPVEELRQFNALASPIRGEIIDVVELLGPLTVAEIASVLGRPADSLYYHVRKLLRVGLLVERETRRTRGRESAVYDVRGRPMPLRYGDGQRGHIQALIKSIAGMLRLAERDFRAAFGAGLVRSSGRRRNVVHSRALGWYTDQEIHRMRSRIQDVIAEFRESSRHRDEEKRPYALTTVMVPLEDRRR